MRLGNMPNKLRMGNLHDKSMSQYSLFYLHKMRSLINLLDDFFKLLIYNSPFQKVLALEMKWNVKKGNIQKGKEKNKKRKHPWHYNNKFTFQHGFLSPIHLSSFKTKKHIASVFIVCWYNSHQNQSTICISIPIHSQHYMGLNKYYN